MRVSRFSMKPQSVYYILERYRRRVDFIRTPLAPLFNFPTLYFGCCPLAVVVVPALAPIARRLAVAESGRDTCHTPHIEQTPHTHTHITHTSHHTHHTHNTTPHTPHNSHAHTTHNTSHDRQTHVSTYTYIHTLTYSTTYHTYSYINI